MTAYVAEPNQPILRFLLRHSVELLALLTVLFVLQTGLVPFDFAEQGQDGTFRAFFSVAVSRQTLPDTVSNIFLYVPVGLLIHWSLCRAVHNCALALLVTLILSTVLSAGIEWGQSYSATRVSSMIDLVGNVTGAAIGAFVSWAGRGIIPCITEGAILELRRRPQALLLKAYCGVLVIFAAIPFSFSFDVTSLKKAARSANFVPFAVVDTTNPSRDLAQAAMADHKAYAYLKWQQMKRYSRWAAEAASFAVLAWLLRSVIRVDYGFKRFATTLLVSYLGGLFAVGLSALQLLVISRACDATDVVFRSCGIGIGLLTRSLFWRRGKRDTPLVLTRNLQTLQTLALTGTVAYILYSGLIPFSFDVDGGRIAASLTSPSFLPLFAYFNARFDMMMTDVAEKFASYLVFSTLLAACWTRTETISTGPRFLTVLIAGVAISTAIEIAQLFNPVRVPSLTDPILAGAACVTGVLLQQLAQHFYHSATLHALHTTNAAERAPASSGDLALGDAIIATLMEPRADAPSEAPSAHTSKKRQ
jgi:glycopeptide antibiotics resistance protein